MKNVDERTVEGFGDEWSTFDQGALADREREELFQRYFSIFPWEELPSGARGFDLGCGSGRWAALVAPRVKELHCIDPSEEALKVARRNLAGAPNCKFHCATVDSIPLDDGSMDFGYSLGVLHHVPDTEAGLAACVRKLRSGAPFLLYLYYRFDNKPLWFRAIWRLTDWARRAVSALPPRRRRFVTDGIALVVYLPLARVSKALSRLGVDVSNVP